MDFPRAARSEQRRSSRPSAPSAVLGPLAVLRQATLLGSLALTALARDLPALLFIHRGSSAIASTTLVVCHVDLFCGIEIRVELLWQIGSCSCIGQLVTHGKRSGDCASRARPSQRKTSTPAFRPPPHVADGVTSIERAQAECRSSSATLQ